MIFFKFDELCEIIIEMEYDLFNYSGNLVITLSQGKTAPCH